MGNIYEEFIKSIKQFFTDGVSIDNYVFKMHRSFTVLLCLVFASILAVEQVSINFLLHKPTKYKPISLMQFYRKFTTKQCAFPFSTPETLLNALVKIPSPKLTAALSTHFVGYTEPTRTTLITMKQMKQYTSKGGTDGTTNMEAVTQNRVLIVGIIYTTNLFPSF